MLQDEPSHLDGNDLFHAERELVLLDGCLNALALPRKRHRCGRPLWRQFAPKSSEELLLLGLDPRSALHGLGGGQGQSSSCKPLGG